MVKDQTHIGGKTTAWSTFTKDLADQASTISGFCSPRRYGTVSGNLVDKGLDTITEGNKIANGFYSSGQQAANVISDYIDYQEKLDSLSAEERKAVEGIKAEYISQGGFQIQDSDGNNVGNRNIYNYQTLMRETELDNDGVTSYFETQTAQDNGASIERYQEALRTSDIDPKVQSYLLGENKYNLHFETMSKEEIEDFNEGVKLLNYAYADSNSGAADRARADFIDNLSNIGMRQ